LSDSPYTDVPEQLLGTAFGAVRYVAQTASTNDDASALLGADEARGTTIVADHQTRGAGRKGRAWIAPPRTSLLFTTILPDGVATADLWAVPFWTAIGVHAALRDCGVTSDVHWPNDLLIAERKLCGILCISRVAGDRASVACGIGINLQRTPGAEREIAPPPAFCSDVATVAREDLLVAILRRFDETLDLLHSPEEVARRWERVAGLPGRVYRLLRDNERTAFEATAIGLASGGALVVERDGKREDVSLADARALREGAD
jgi:BirA family biotin operon repressor/biotin-[acetyl-CoA-carboxylase] ligase